MNENRFSVFSHPGECLKSKICFHSPRGVSENGGGGANENFTPETLISRIKNPAEESSEMEILPLQRVLTQGKESRIYNKVRDSLLKVYDLYFKVSGNIFYQYIYLIDNATQLSILVRRFEVHSNFSGIFGDCWILSHACSSTPCGRASISDCFRWSQSILTGVYNDGL